MAETQQTGGYGFGVEVFTEIDCQQSEVHALLQIHGRRRGEEEYVLVYFGNRVEICSYHLLLCFFLILNIVVEVSVELQPEVLNSSIFAERKED